MDAEARDAITQASRALSIAIERNPSILEGPEHVESLPDRFRAHLVAIAGKDLTGEIDQEEATRLFSEAIDTLVADALESVVTATAEKHPIVTQTPFAVIAMGKWGAGELNYYSDIDLVFVHDSAPESANESRSAALAVASGLIATLTAPTFDGTMLHVDADLRPEGAMGPLSRSLESYEAYYERWAEAWELQALLKARFAAGDVELGSRFERLASKVVWEEGLDVDALRSIRHIKAQAEAGAPRDDIKRSPGGIRDIEFTIQLLQLVHGRFDDDLRVRPTLEAIRRLGSHGYIEEDEATRLISSYSFLRDVEHRVQLWDLQQTHRIPRNREGMERVGRSLGLMGNPAEALSERLGTIRSDVRNLHERLYFRPILDSLVGLPSATLDRDEAAVRLESLGFRDVNAATRSLEEMTSGLSRRSRVMQQVLPLMLDWLSQSPDPDLGLDQLRVLLARTTDHSELVRLLQVNPLAGERLCLLLGTGRLLGDWMDRIPEFIPRLADDARIRQIRDGDDVWEQLEALLDARPGEDARIGTIRRFARRRKLRIAARDVLGEGTTEETLMALSDTADAAIRGGLRSLGDGEQDGFAVLAMGKWGGSELSYSSDLDVMYVFDDPMERETAITLTSELDRVVSQPSKHGEAYLLDAEIRPEGRKGPMARSFDSFDRYYSEWVEPWELLALVKARPVAGDQRLRERFTELVAETIWSGPPTEQQAHEIRRIKARVETERMPAGEDPDFHLKLGPGGLTDIEFATQLLQLRHGHLHEELRVTGTLGALAALRERELLGKADFNALRDSYLFCTRVRLRLHLQSGRVLNSLPTDPAASSRLASSLGLDRSSELREQYRKHTRHARTAFEKLFFD